MAKIAVTYSEAVGGASVVSLKKVFSSFGQEVVDADYREMMSDISQQDFETLYSTPEGRMKLFAHAKQRANEFLEDIDCLALSGNTAMIDPELFNEQRKEGSLYDYSRTIAEMALVHVATRKGMPILGICGGHQVVAVYAGGTISGLSSEHLDKQKFMDYDKIVTNADTVMRAILKDNPEVFGAHNQVVEKAPEKGFVVSATSQATEAGETKIEALEAEHGAPLMTTQFHPEVAVKGLPKLAAIYENKDEVEKNKNLKLLEYFSEAANAYAAKRAMHAELLEIAEVNVNSFSSQAQATPVNAKAKQASQKPRKAGGVSWGVVILIVAAALISAGLMVVFPPAGLVTALFALGLSTTGATMALTALGAAVGVAVGFMVTNARAILFSLANIISKWNAGFAENVREKVSEKATKSRVDALRKEEALQQDSMQRMSEMMSSADNSDEPQQEKAQSKTPEQILNETPASAYQNFFEEEDAAEPTDDSASSPALDATLKHQP